MNAYSLPEVASMLHVSLSTVRRQIIEGKITKIKIGKNVRVTNWELERYLRACEQETPEQTPTVKLLRTTKQTTSVMAELQKLGGKRGKEA